MIPMRMTPRPNIERSHQTGNRNVVVSRTRWTRAWAWECLGCGEFGIVRPVRLEHESMLDYGNRGKRAKRQCVEQAEAHRCPPPRLFAVDG